MPQKPKIRVPAIVPQHKNAHFAPCDAKEEVIAEHMKPSSADGILEKTEVGRIGCDSILGSLYFRKNDHPISCRPHDQSTPMPA